MLNNLEAAFGAHLTACFLPLELSEKFLSYFEDVDYSIEVTKFVSSSVPQSRKVLYFVVNNSFLVAPPYRRGGRLVGCLLLATYKISTDFKNSKTEICFRLF